MPTDLTISSAGTPVATPDRTRSLQAAPATTFEPRASGPPPPSPTLRYDASLGLLVIEFHNDAGQVSDSIPTQRQLDAYRARAEGGPQPTPLPVEQPANPSAKSGIVA